MEQAQVDSEDFDQESTSTASSDIPQAIGAKTKKKTPQRRRTSKGWKGAKTLDPEEQLRLQELRSRRASEMKVKLHSLESVQKDRLLDTILTRLPGLMFDVMAMFEVSQSPDPVGDVLHWCTCTNCREMDTDLERLCCRQIPENCISNMAHMEFYVLDEGVLRLARAAWNDIFAVDDSQEPGVEQRQYRHAAYRQFVLWQHGRLGVGNRVVIPSCCVWKIRIKFPDPRGQYTGFRVRRLH